jgi:hypothetical protein
VRSQISLPETPRRQPERDRLRRFAPEARHLGTPVWNGEQDLSAPRHQRALLQLRDVLRVGRDLAEQPGAPVYCAGLRVRFTARDELQRGTGDEHPCAGFDDRDVRVIVESFGQLQLAVHLIDVRVTLPDLIRLSLGVLQLQDPAERVVLDEALVAGPERHTDLVALDEALTTLAAVDERKSKVVELRFFGGLNEAEMAEALGVSPETVRRDWRLAKVWLLRFLSGGRDGA